MLWNAVPRTVIIETWPMSVGQALPPCLEHGVSIRWVNMDLALLTDMLYCRCTLSLQIKNPLSSP